MKIKNYIRNLFLLIVFSILSINFNYAQLYPGTINIGIFESSTPNQMDIRIIPTDSTILTLTNMVFTVKWPSGSNNIIFGPPIYPYLLIPQDTPIFNNGYLHQTFASMGGYPLNLNANQESTILTFTYSENCGEFEVIDNWTYNWTYNNHNGGCDGSFYVEIMGYNKTGIIYNPMVNNCNIIPSSINQTIITKIDSLISQVHLDTIIIPITVTRVNDIKGISLTLDYDNTILDYYSYQNPQTNLAVGDLIVNSNGSQVIVSWYSLIPIDIMYDTLIEIKFIVNNNGSSNLSWDLSVPGNCEYFGDSIVPSQYINSEVIIVSPTILTELPSFRTCDNNIIVPITVSNINNINAISLTLQYDNITLNWDGYQNIQPQLSNGNLAINSIGNEIKFSWFGINPLNFGNDTLVELKFTTDIGHANLYWILSPVENCEYMDANNNVILSKYINGVIDVELCGYVEGKVTYDNIINSPMNNCIVILKDEFDKPVNTTISGLFGDYNFLYLLSDIYSVETSTDRPWGGVNSTDALGIANHFAQIQILQGLKLLAADVTGDGGVNSTDALAVAQRFVGHMTSFPVGDWLIPINTFMLPPGGIVMSNIKGICYGDVNGSYIPTITKRTPTVQIKNDDIINVGNVFSVPLKINKDIQIGAISLILNYPKDYIEILGVSLLTDGGNLVYNINDGELKIAWFSIKPYNVTLNDKIIILDCRIKKEFIGDISFYINNDYNNEFSNIFCDVIEDVVINIPKIKIKQEIINSNFWVVYPTIVSNTLHVEYHISNIANVTFTLFDITGKQVWKKSLHTNIGSHKEDINTSKYISGVYFLRMTVNGNSTNIKIIIK